jgi:GNAT superfamily N-acetyltransferase
LRRSFRIRWGTETDTSAIERLIVEWLDWKIPREESIKRAIRNRELLLAEQGGKVIGFIHFVMHEDIIDGGLNSFITAFYVVPELRNKGVGSALLHNAIQKALKKGAVGVEASTASPEARQLYERHRFRQFMGKNTMGEVFLELDVDQYKKESRTNHSRFRTAMT